jgi:hypothetical protein
VDHEEHRRRVEAATVDLALTGTHAIEHEQHTTTVTLDEIQERAIRHAERGWLRQMQDETIRRASISIRPHRLAWDDEHRSLFTGLEHGGA